MVGLPLIWILLGIIGINTILISIILRIIVLISAILVLARSNFENIIKNKFNQLFLLFFLFYYVRVVYDTLVVKQNLGQPIIDYYLFPFFVVVLPSLALQFSDNYFGKKNHLWMILITAFGILVISLIIGNFQYNNGTFRLYGGYNLHPITLGNLSVTSILISSFLLMNDTNRFLRIFLFLNLLIGLLVLGLTESRGPILSLILCIILIFSQLSNKQKLYLIFCFIIWAIYLLVFTELHTRLYLTISGGGDRMQHWIVSIDQFFESPLFGHSLEERVNKIYPHNIIIEGFLSLGILGGVGIIIILFSIIKKSLVSKLNITTLLFIQYFIGSLFSGSIYSNYLMWYLGMLVLTNYKNMNIRNIN